MQSKKLSRIDLLDQIDSDFNKATLKRERIAGQEVEINRLLENPYQPRIAYDPIKIQELADSIQKNGLIQPITIGVVSAKYYIIAGHRRVEAYKKIGLPKIQALLKDYNPNEFKRVASSQALAENIHRDNLKPLELALTFDRLIDEGVFRTYEDIAVNIAKTKRYITRIMSLLKLSNQARKIILQEKRIPIEILETVAKIKDENSQVSALGDYLKNNFDLKQLKAKYITTTIQEKKAFDYNKKKSLVSIDITQYKSKDDLLNEFKNFLEIIDLK